MKIKKHIALPIILFIYTTIMGAIFIPQNTGPSITDKVITLLVCYIIIIVLYFVLKKKSTYKNNNK